MNEQASRDLRNVIAFALIDGKLDEGEKRFIDALRVKLGIGDQEFRQLCDQIQQEGKKVFLPRDPGQAQQALRLLVEIAQADGQISRTEREMLQRLAQHVGLDLDKLGEMMGERPADQAPAGSAPAADDALLEGRLEDIYAQFGPCDHAQRRQMLAQFAAMGGQAVMPLLRLLESYRVPEGMASNLEVKTLVAEQLGLLGDERAVYYLVQQVNIGDMEDEITNADFRFAAAEAIGKITGLGFSPNQQGVLQVRRWWTTNPHSQYNQLAMS